MLNQPIETSLTDKAIIFAVKAHSGTRRKGKQLPYIIHPLEAMLIVGTMTSDHEVLAAAVLHDVLEDTLVTVNEFRAEFGERILRMVLDESDSIATSEEEKPGWKERKQAAMLKLAGAPTDSKMVALGDKLSNMRAIANDYARVGDEIWNIFSVKDKSLHEWHYRGLADCLKELSCFTAYQEFVSLIDKVFGND